VWKKEGGHVGVVLEEIALGEVELGPEELLEVCQSDGASGKAEVEVLHVRG
jgi:hypothetical protein